MPYVDIASIQVPTKGKNSPVSAWMNAVVADQVFKEKFHGCRLTASTGTVVGTIPSAPTNTYQIMAYPTASIDTDSYAHASTGAKIPTGLGGLYLISYEAQFGEYEQPIRTKLALNGLSDSTAAGPGNLAAQTFRVNFTGDWQATQVRYTTILPLNVGDTIDVYAQALTGSPGTFGFSGVLELAFLGATGNPISTYGRLRSINNPADFAKAPATWGNRVRENLQAQSQAVGIARELLFEGAVPSFLDSAPSWLVNAPSVGVQFPPSVPKTSIWGLDWDPYDLWPSGQQAFVVPEQYAGVWLVNAHVVVTPREAFQQLEQSTMFQVGIAQNSGSGFAGPLGRAEVGADQTPLFAPSTYCSEIVIATPGTAILPYVVIAAPGLSVRHMQAMYITAAWLGAEAS